MKQTLACSLHEIARILSTDDSPADAPTSGINSGTNSGTNNGTYDGVSSVGAEGQEPGSPGGPGGPGGSVAFTGSVSLVEVELIPIFESMLQVSNIFPYLYVIFHYFSNCFNFYFYFSFIYPPDLL